MTDDIRAAATALLRQIDVVVTSAEYRGAAFMAAMHGCRDDGPNWQAEYDVLEAALAQPARPIVTIDAELFEELMRVGSAVAGAGCDLPGCDDWFTCHLCRAREELGNVLARVRVAREGK